MEVELGIPTGPPEADVNACEQDRVEGTSITSQAALPITKQVL